MEKWENKTTEDLFKVVLKLKTQNEVKRFFRDLLTEPEIIEFGKRWQAAKMLSQKISYSQIEKETGLSSTTVARVAKWLNGKMGGYRLMLQRLNSHHHASFTVGKGLR